ncbi:hypothetical protein C3007_03470 [Avibacterium gallinarum]|uniref:Uncharacterized protein n=1 Tax=Avibacterium gallinarum TaxID=755 RepID=A0A379AWN8_AVIGA|nr:hypothetical protein [Avibacterium gallinarum]POY44756.1 hypothetical protein C3007_03470 [Avibacterium gallinarum]TDP30158.1 hypothetical protein EV689_101185 [Avibacterium gallinarum]SUB26659.1 Uncharacterised protein [Avibacterium gallinarum]
MRKYTLELDGQRDFYQTYLPRIDKTLTLEQILTDNTDGVLNGNLLEFKLNINDVNSVLFQAIKYLSAMRVKGKSIPANIVLISLNTAKAYLFNSKDYLQFIEKIYTLGASKENSGFQGGKPRLTFNLENQIDQETLIATLKSKNYTKINLDENCIVGWGERFYRENPLAKKADFIGEENGKVKIIGEIRKPDKFKNFIEPYTGEDNVKFRYLMDKLNDNLMQKNLGAFYTPKLYAEKSLELLRQAIARVPKDNDYIILDRCAGTGNLQQYFTDEELSHTIVSTVEYYEYKVLFELLGDKVRHIIPPTESSDTFNAGLVRGADALSEEYVKSTLIKQYVDNPKCTIILFENPPYSEVNGTTIGTGKKAIWKQSFVSNEMKKEIKGSALNDLANLFIWSAFKYYLRQPTDSYIVYSPIKYWKAHKLIDRKFIAGFAFNRKHFHTKTNACISCIYWSNEISMEKTFKLTCYDIDVKSNQLLDEGSISVHQIDSQISEYYDKRQFTGDSISDGICVDLNGKERDKDKSCPLVKKYNQNIIGYVVANSSGFDNPRLNSALTVTGRYDAHGEFLRSDNFIEILPIFSAGKYTDHENNWKIMSMIMKSADGKEKYHHDLKNGKLNLILLKNLLWVSLTHYSHIRSIEGSDGRFYRNQLCLDCSNGDTLAREKLNNFILNKEETKLLKQWDLVLKNAKETANYNPSYTYGAYQIEEELNTRYKDEKGNTVYDYPELNGHLKTLKQLVKIYYQKEIVPFLFEYQFLK